MFNIHFEQVVAVLAFRLGLDFLHEALVEVLRDVLAVHLHERVHRDDLENHGEVLARRHGDDDFRDAYAHDDLLELVEAGAVVVRVALPGLEFHDDFDLLYLADGVDTEHRADVEDSHAADFHVVADERVGPADDAVTYVANMDNVVCNHAVAAFYKVEYAFGFAHVAVAHEEHTDTVDVHEAPVDNGMRREELFEDALCNLVEFVGV